MTQVLSTGFDRTRLDERLLALQTRVRSIFGAGINLDPDTVDGQMLGIYAEFLSNLDQLAEDVYHSMNPQSVTGAAQSRLVQLNGIRRSAGAYSTVSLSCTGTPGTIIPAGSRVRSSGTTSRFATTAEAVIGVGGLVVTPANATEYGPIDAPADTLTQIDSPIFGWVGVTNVFAADPGRYEESDSELRIRRSKSTSAPAQSILDGIYGALANLPGVQRAKVYENDTDIVDANGMPPHSVYAIVDGSTAQAIADALWLRKTLGATTFGALHGDAVDSRGGLHRMNYGVPIGVPIWLEITVSRKPGWPSSGAYLIQEAVKEWALAKQDIGDDVSYSRLFEPINSVPGHTVTLLTLGTAASPVTSVDVAIAFDNLAVFDSSRILVTVV